MLGELVQTTDGKWITCILISPMVRKRITYICIEQDRRSGITTVRFGQSFAMTGTNDWAAWCPICGEAAEVVQVSIEDGWSEAATHLVTIRACTNRYCEGHHPAVRQKVHATTPD